MAASPAALAGLALAGLIAGLATLTVTLIGGHATERGAYTFPPIALAIGWGFIGTGLFARWRRPENRTGALMVAVGFAWFLGSLGGSDLPLLHTLGLLGGTLWGGLLLHLALAFPSGRLRALGDRALVVSGYFATTALQVAPLLFAERYSLSCRDCPRNLALHEPRRGLADALFSVQLVAFGAIALLACAAFLRRWRGATAPQRRALAPVLLSLVATGTLLFLTAAAEAARLYGLSNAID